MTERTVVVIGGGLVGCFSAYYLKSFGWDVTLVERNAVGSGASHGNCGYICPSHALPLSGPGVIAKTLPKLLTRDSALSIPARWNPELWKWLLRFRSECTNERMMATAAARVALLGSSAKLYDQLLGNQSPDNQSHPNATISAEHQRRGLLTVYKTTAAFEHFAETADMLKREFDIATTAYAGPALTIFEPTLRDDLAGGWLFDHDSHVRPDRLMKSLQAALEESGVQVLENTTVTKLSIENRRTRGIETASGMIDCSAVVVATGAEAAMWAKSLGCRVPIQPGKGYSITMPRLPRQPRVPMIFEESHVAVTPFADAFRIGSTMEFAGYDRSLNPKRIDLLRRSTREHMAEPIPDDAEETWCGWRPMSVDGLPSIGPVPAASNLLLAAGNGMIGLASAPATGKLVAELASSLPTHVDAAPYRPTRFE